MKAPFTIYRCTQAFMSTLNRSIENRNTHRARTSTFGEDVESINTQLQAIKSLLANNHLLPVATVNCEESRLFEVTNTISRNWTENPEVHLLTGAEIGFLSSSSVGDIFADATGDFYLYGPSSVVLINKKDILQSP